MARLLKPKAQNPQSPDASLWSFGVGYLHDALRVDAGVNAKSFMQNGPFFVTGVSTGTAAAPVLFVVSASYDLGPSTQELAPSSSIAIPPAPPAQPAPSAAPASAPTTR